jgi:hypothetical protein
LKLLRFSAIIIFFAGVLFFAISLAVTQIPAVQNILAKAVTKKLGESINYPISFEKVSIGWFNELVLHDVLIQDRHKYEMIKVDNIVAKFKFPSLIKTDIELEKATLIHPVVKLYFDPEVNDVNLSDFIYSLTHMGDTSKVRVVSIKPAGYKYPAFKIKEVELKDAVCTFDDPTIAKKKDRFDFAHFKFEKIDIHATDFSIVADTVRMQLNIKTATDTAFGLKITDLHSDFGICEHFIKLNKLSAYLGDTYISDYVLMEFNKFSNLSYIEDSVRINMNLKNSRIHSKDIAIFQPDLRGFYDVWRVTGNFKGKVSNFDARNMHLGFGKNSVIVGKGHFNGLPEWEKTTLDVEAKNAFVNSNDLKKYGLKNVANLLDKFGTASLSGKFYGFPSNFATEAQIATPIGKIHTDIILKSPKDNFEGSYHMIIKTENLEIGKILEQNLLGKISSEVIIDGTGFRKDNMEMNIISKIPSFEFKNFIYQNLHLNGNISKQYFHGSLDASDKNLKLDLIGNINFANNQESIILDADIQKLNLSETGLWNKKINVATRLKLRTNGWDFEKLEGSVECHNMVIKDSLQKCNIQNLDIKYSKEDKNRTLSIHSELFKLDIDGNFELSRFTKDLQEMIADVQTNWENDENKLSFYYKNKKQDPFYNQKFNCKAVLSNFNPLANIFLPGYYFSKNTVLTGYFLSEKSNDFEFQTNTDTIGFAGITYVKPNAQFRINKSKTNSGIISEFKFTSDYQIIDNANVTENLSISANWDEKIVDFDFYVKQFQESNYTKLGGRITFMENVKKLKFIDSHFSLLDKEWKMNDENFILFSANKAEFSNVEIGNDIQKISISGVISPDEGKAALMRVDNFNLMNFNKLLGIKISGELNAYVMLKDIYKDPRIYAQLRVNDLKIRKLQVGDIKGLSNWDSENKRMNLNLDVVQSGSKIFELSGFYQPKTKNPNEHLQLDISLKKANISIFEPFLGDVITEMNGEATGNLKLNGSLSKPLLSGKVFVEEGVFKVAYLNTKYTFSDYINFEPDKIIFSNSILYDSQNKIVVVDGQFSHSNYNNFQMDLNGAFEGVEILNTGKTDSSIYYGKAIATGKFNIIGSTENFKIKVDARAEKGTSLYLPIQGENSVQKKEYISFVKKGKNAEKTLKSRLKRINNDKFLIDMDFNFEFTPDAYCEIILDPISGDKISGYGNGKFNLQINTDGDFSILGRYEFERESYYNFTFLNSINKKFNIQKGSLVTFNGDPYAGQIDVKATYDDRVSLHPLVTDTSAWRVPGVKTPYPVSTILYLKGDLLKPVIKYDIVIKDYPTAIGSVPMFSYVTAFENKVRNNENEMNYQVFGLLVFRRFMSTGTGLENALGGTVSELISNQLSGIISQIDPNLSLDVNMNGLNRDALNAMQVRVSYTLLDGKIRITRSTGNTQNQTAAANIIGEWTVEYMLTPDGKYRLKGFNKNNPNVMATSQGNAGNTAAGFSIMHTAGFNSLNPFAKKKKKPTDKENNKPALNE